MATRFFPVRAQPLSGTGNEAEMAEQRRAQTRTEANPAWQCDFVLVSWRGRMKKLHAALLTLAAIAFAVSVSAQVKPELALKIRTLSNSGYNGQIEWDSKTGMAVITNGVEITYGDAVLTADEARVNSTTGEVLAAGHVRILRDDLAWMGDSIRYNFKTLLMEAEQFRAAIHPHPRSRPARTSGRRTWGAILPTRPPRPKTS